MFFGHYVFLSFDYDVTLRQITLRNHDITIEFVFLKSRALE